MVHILNYENIDTRFDDYFDKTLALTWLPWIGKSFFNTDKKTLILGESTYFWDQTPETSARIAKNDHLRILHQNHALNFNRDSKYVRNIERAIFNKKCPKDAEKELLWSSVAYHNLVLSPMANINQRPTDSQYHSGWIATLELIRKLEIEQVIVYGLEKSKWTFLVGLLKEKGIDYRRKKSEVAVGKHVPKKIVMKNDSLTTTLVFIRHPSAFFSWRKWATYLAQELSLPRQL